MNADVIVTIGLDRYFWSEMTIEEHDPGARMSAEIAEQPALLADLLDHRQDIADVAADIAANPPRMVLLAARGSSDHAAMYAKYLIEVGLGLPVGMVSPSVTTLYGTEPDLRDVLLVTVSQSGGSPDLLRVAESARERGARTLVVTNTPDSPLSQASEQTVHIRAGQERAVAATKTYTCTLFAFYLLIDAIRGGDASAVRDIAATAERTLADSGDAVHEAVSRYRFVGKALTTARGYSYATASEAALKLAETSYLGVRAYSGADLLHGPVAAVDPDTAVLALASRGHGAEAMTEVLRTVSDRGADILAVGSAATDVTAHHGITVPTSAEEVAPILEVLPVQRLALRLAVSRGNDPDNPRGLAKVTRTL